MEEYHPEVRLLLLHPAPRPVRRELHPRRGLEESETHFRQLPEVSEKFLDGELDLFPCLGPTPIGGTSHVSVSIPTFTVTTPVHLPLLL